MLQLTNADFSKLLRIANSLREKTLNSGDIKKAYTTGFNDVSKMLLYKMLQPYLQPAIGEFKIHVAMLLEEFIPWTIHTDYPKGDENPGYAVLIPLETIDSHTVVFNEECLDDFETYKNNHEPIINNCSYLHQSILSHISAEDLGYVSLRSIEKWEEGKLIIWDRVLLHTSDNFLAAGLSEKRAVVVFTSRV